MFPVSVFGFVKVSHFPVDHGEGDAVAVGGVDEVGEAFDIGQEEAGGLSWGDGMA